MLPLLAFLQRALNLPRQDFLQARAPMQNACLRPFHTSSIVE